MAHSSTGMARPLTGCDYDPLTNTPVNDLPPFFELHDSQTHFPIVDVGQSAASFISEVGATVTNEGADWSKETPIFTGRHHLPSTLSGSPPTSRGVETKGPAPAHMSPAVCDALLSPRATPVIVSMQSLITTLSGPSPKECSPTSAAAPSINQATSVQSTSVGTTNATATSSASTSPASNEDHTSIFKKRMLHYRRYDKPPYSYLGIIIVVIQYSPTGAMTLSEVVQVLPRIFSFFSGTYKGWKDSIRHNLSSTKCFKKALGSEGKGHGRGTRWMVDWKRVPQDVFKLQHGRPGSKNPEWKPTLHQYLRLPDVHLPVSEVSNQNQPIPAFTASPALYDARSSQDMKWFSTGPALQSSLASLYPMPTTAPVWFPACDNSQPVGIDLSSKLSSQKSDNDSKADKSPLASLPRATSTPNPKGFPSHVSASDELPASPGVVFPCITGPSLTPLASLPAWMVQQANDSQDMVTRQCHGLDNLPLDLNSHRSRHPSAMSDHNSDRSRHLSATSDLNSNRSRHLSATSDLSCSRSRHPSAISLSSDQGYITAEDSLNQASIRFGRQYGMHQPAPGHHSQPPSCLPQPSGPYNSISSCLGSWHRPSYTFPYLPCQTATMQHMPATPASVDYISNNTLHPASHIPGSYHDFFPPSMQFCTQGPPSYVGPSYSSTASPHVYDSSPLHGPYSQYPFHQDVHQSLYPAYLYSHSATSPAPAASAITSVLQHMSATGKKMYATQVSGRGADQSAEGSNQLNSNTSTISPSSAIQLRTCKHPRLPSASQPPAKRPATLGVSPPSVSSSGRASANLRCSLPMDPLVFSPVSDEGF